MSKRKSAFDRDVARAEKESAKHEALGHLPAIPPSDYKGGVGHWMRELQERGLWNGEGFHGDVWLTREQYGELLDECEAGR